MRIRTLTGLTVAGATLLAACGGGGGSSAAPATPATPRHATDTGSGGTAVAVRSTSLGNVLVDAQGRTLYGFTNDVNGTSTCTGGCATIWPALTVTAGWNAGAGADRSTFHTVGTGSSMQLATAKWPLYRYAGDNKPGDVNGEGIQGRWFAVAPDGSLIKAPAASTSAPTAAPAMSGGGY